MGSLFAEKTPLLESLELKEWDNVGLIVVGEEGSDVVKTVNGNVR